MLGSPFFRRLFVPYMLVVCATTLGVGLVGVHRVRAVYGQSRQKALRDQTLLVSRLVPVPTARLPGDPSAQRELETTTRELASALRCRVTIIDSGGKVLADSEADPRNMEPHGDRAEVMQASQAGEGMDVRLSHTVGRNMMYFARKVESPGGAYYVRLAVDMQDLERGLRYFYTGVALAALFAMLAAALVCYYFARRQAAPMVELTRLAQALSQGQLHRRAMTREAGELGTLAASLNTMAQSLGELLESSRRSQTEHLAILTAMSEGVIATDLQQRIILVNTAAGVLLSFDSATARGKLLCEVLQHERILRSAADVIERGVQQTFPVGPMGGRHLEITLCRYPAKGNAEGLVVLAHDTTQSVRYQDLRKEFVANVSHELRTPITVIKGFVETLLDQGVGDPETVCRHLATISRHTDQLTNLVNDLLELSRLEGPSELPQRSSIDLAAVVHKAADLLAPAAQSRSHTVSVSVAADLPHMVGNADFLERAVANLLDNAIKYTPEGGRIELSARTADSQVIIEVTDNGIGIPADDIPRIFERFYRVDRSRSREMGGTGLGLSIVKHVAQVHGGSVDVTSAPGKGSTFRLKLPVPRN